MGVPQSGCTRMYLCCRCSQTFLARRNRRYSEMGDVCTNIAPGFALTLFQDRLGSARNAGVQGLGQGDSAYRALIQNGLWVGRDSTGPLWRVHPIMRTRSSPGPMEFAGNLLLTRKDLLPDITKRTCELRLSSTFLTRKQSQRTDQGVGRGRIFRCVGQRR
jgi:hypothetical protein